MQISVHTGQNFKLLAIRPLFAFRDTISTVSDLVSVHINATALCQNAAPIAGRTK